MTRMVAESALGNELGGIMPGGGGGGGADAGGGGGAGGVGAT